MRSDSHRRIGPALLVIVFAVVLSALPLSRPAYAVWTPNHCDSAAKYYCYSELYEPYSGGVTLQTRSVWCGLDGGYNWCQRWILEDWRNNSGSWTFIQSWPATAPQYSDGWQSVTLWTNIDNEAVSRNQRRGQINVSPYPVDCEPYVDWHVSSTGYYVSEGSYVCL